MCCIDIFIIRFLIMYMESTCLADQIIKDTDPIIAMDVKLKRDLNQSEVLHVDYAALRKTISTFRGPTDNSGLTVNLMHRSNMPSNIAGSFDPHNQSVEIKFRRAPAKNQKVLQHELWHYVDLTLSPATPLETGRVAVGNTLMRLTNPATVVTLGDIAIKIAALIIQQKGMLDPEISRAIIDSNIGVYTGRSLFGLCAAGGLLYYTNPRECSARKRSREVLPQIVHRASQ